MVEAKLGCNGVFKQEKAHQLFPAKKGNISLLKRKYFFSSY